MSDKAKRGRPRSPERQLAIAEGRNRYFTGVPCANGHIADRLVRKSLCVACRNKKRARGRGPEAKRRQRERRKERNYLAGLTAAGNAWIKLPLNLSKEERRLRKREIATKMRVALKVLEELGIQI